MNAPDDLRSLDAAIAEKLFGFHRSLVGGDIEGKHGGAEVLLPPTMDERMSWDALPKRGPVALWYFCASYSTDIVAAIRVVEEMQREEGQAFSCGRHSLLAQWKATFTDLALAQLQKPNAAVSVEAATLPEAICRAALAVLNFNSPADSHTPSNPT